MLCHDVDNKATLHCLDLWGWGAREGKQGPGGGRQVMTCLRLSR